MERTRRSLSIRTRLAASVKGLSARDAGLAIVVGVTLGLFPIYGCPTLLCALASLVLGLNLPAVQMVNQIATPLQLAMLTPFVRLGARMVSWPHTGSFAAGLGVSALQAVTGWVCVCLPVGILLYFTLACFPRCFETGRRWRGCVPGNWGFRRPRNYACPRLAAGNG
jgi:hypothetical protein